MAEQSKAFISAGGIVIGDSGMIALVRREGGTKWLFPKGRVEENETHEDAARREIAEEAGLTNLELLDDLGSYERFAIKKDGTYDMDCPKTIHMYLFAAVPHAELAPTMEIEEARWFSYRELANHIGDEKDRVWYGTVFDRVREAIQRD